MYENVQYNIAKPDLMQRVEKAWLLATTTSKVLIPSTIRRWKNHQCLLRVNKEVLNANPA
jgi:hypothetical protein